MAARRVLHSTDIMSQVLSHLSLDDADTSAPCKSWLEPRARRLRGMLRVVQRIDGFGYRGGITPFDGGGLGRCALVSDYQHCCLKLFSSSGILMATLCQGGLSLREVSASFWLGRHVHTPVAIVPLGDGTAWVLCKDRETVLLVRLATGEHLIKKTRDGFEDPMDLALVGDDLLVLCAENIVVLDAATGVFRRHFADGLASYGGALAMCGDLVYVADTHNHAVKVFRHSDGTLVRRFGKEGEAPDSDWSDDEPLDERASDEPGFFNEPSGVAAANGKLYVSEDEGRRIQVLSLPDGRPLQEIVVQTYHRLLGLGRLALIGDRVWCFGAHDNPTRIFIFAPYA